MKIRYLKELCVLLCILTLTIAYAVTATAQEKTAAITGVVMNEQGEYLPGVSVNARNSKTGFQAGTTTNESGVFRFDRLPEGGPYSFTFTYVGFEDYVLSPYTIKDGATISLIAKLKDKGKLIEEVVVTGYTKQSKRDVTGAASTISTDVISKTPVSDVSSILQGRVAGVSVDGQGGPGNSQVIRVRGIGTLGNNDPLYVIDGVQIRMGKGTTSGSQDVSNLINPNDIESLTILKDPSLIALYGAEGSNGVIVITTKSGKMGAPRFEYNGYAGYQMPQKFPSMITPQQQANALYASYANSSPAQLPTPYYTLFGNGTSPVLPDYIIQSTADNLGVKAGDPLADPSLYNLNTYRILQANKSGTDWWREVFKPAFTQNHQLMLSGATDKSNYAVTMGYMDDKGTMLNSFFKRLSLRVNTQFKIKPWLRLGENVEMSYTNTNSGGDRSFNGTIASLYQMSGLLPTHDIAGNLAGTKGTSFFNKVGNPLTNRIYSTNSKNYAQAIIGSAYLEAEPIKHLVYTSQIGFQFLPFEYRSFVDTLPQEPGSVAFNSFTEGGGYGTDWRWLNKLAYSTTIANVHKLSAFVAYEARQYMFRTYSGTTGGLSYAQPAGQYLSGGNANIVTPMVAGGGDKYTNASVFGNLSYSLMDKYLLNGTVRRDGSSKFGPNNKYGTFGAVSAGWRISRENFLQKVDWINDLKLRGSYGSTGNDAIPSGLYLATLGTGSFGYYDLDGKNTSSMQGYYPNQIGNPNLHWETNVTTNIGFDALLFNNKLSASFNWFDKKTKGLLYAPPSTGTAGAASSPWQNVMTFTNKGVELELGYHSHVGKVNFDMNFNIATYRNKVVYINGVDSAFIAGGGYDAGYGTLLTRSVVGKPVSSFYGYVQDGIFQNASEINSYATQPGGLTADNGVGHFRFKDISGAGGKPDGVVNDKDETYLGNPNPKFTYGYSLNVYYKQFDLGIFLQGVYGNKIFNYWRKYSRWPGALEAGSLDTWTSSNTKASLPIYTQDGLNVNHDALPSSYFIENGSYLRLKSLQLGYTFNKLKGVDRLRIYVQAFNLFTVTKYSGLDPEVSTGDPNSLGIDYGTAYPISTKVLFGVNLGL